MRPLLERLNEEVLVCDGAMGTMLIESGMPNGVCPEEWAVNKPGVLLSTHKAYVDAGADMIITNTFGANVIKLDKFKLRDKVEVINKKAVEIAKKAAGDKAYVLGDIGPTGGYLKPVGNIEPDELLAVFTQQARALCAAGVDAIILETISDLEELKTAIMAVKENTKLPLIASMTFQNLKEKGFRTTSGISIPQFVNDSLLSGCDVIGTNCTISITEMIGLVSEIRSLCSSFIIAEPNAGMPQLEGAKTVYKQTADEFVKDVPQLICAGANIVGGCCGTTPEHIRKLKQVRVIRDAE